jgi:hypothetical protein
MPQSTANITLPMTTVADLQDSLLVVMNDLQRLSGLLDHATENLMSRFSVANQALVALGEEAHQPTRDIQRALQMAVTELQFHDMASQLIVHTDKILKACAYKLAEEAMGLDDDETPGAHIEVQAPRPNPVTQSEMDAGSVELF